MDQTSPELASALMQWINTFPLPKPVNSWDDLSDGSVLWAALNDIDPEYFDRSLPDVDRKAADNWIPRWQNWKHIEKELLQYIQDQGDRFPNLGRRMDTDLKAIATSSSKQDILKMVKCVLLAAMFSANANERMVEVMSSLGPKVAQPIAGFIGEVEEISQTDYVDIEPSSDIEYSSEVETPSKDAAYQRDPELEREERLISALQDKKKVEAKLADALAELEENRQRTTALEDELEESKYALDRRRGKSVDHKNFAQLSQRADQDRQYIDELESELASAKQNVDQQERQLERFKLDAQSKQELRDELQLITNERDELRQKAKANENLKRKIQTLQEQEKSTQALRHDLQIAQEQLQEYDTLKERCSALEKANEENAQTIANGEQEIFDQKTAKRMLEYELKTVTQKWEQSKDLLGNAQDTIRDLEERMHEVSHSPSEEKTAGNLDDELNPPPVSESPSDASKAKEKAPTITADSIVLQQKLNIAASSVERLEKRCLDLLQENLGLKGVVDGAAEKSVEESHPFQHQAKRLEELEKELDELKSKYFVSSSQITDLKQRLEAAKGEAVDGDTIALKANQERQEYIKDLEETLGDQRNLLRHALLGPEALQKEESTLRATNEYKLIRHQLDIVHKAPTDEAEDVIKSTATGLTDRIEGVRGSLAAKEKLLLEREEEFAHLQKENESLKMRPPPVPPKDEPTDKEMQQRLQQLERENKLIASAWYDITCRLQSNTVHLARRAEGGRSWLGRMRTAVNVTGGAAAGRRI